MKAYQLTKLHKNDLITTSRVFLTKANALGATLLGPHGFSADDLTAWGTLLDDFGTDAEAPAVGREVRKTNTALLAKKVGDALRWMTDEMDDTAKAYKRLKPDFYQLYDFAREKHHQGHHHNGDGDNGEGGTPGEYVMDILKGGGMVVAGFPLLATNTYLAENIGNTKLRFWTQSTSELPASIPVDAGFINIGDEMDKTGGGLGAPDKPFLFFGNDNPTEDGQVSVNIVEHGE